MVCCVVWCGVVWLVCWFVGLSVGWLVGWLVGGWECVCLGEGERGGRGVKGERRGGTV